MTVNDFGSGLLIATILKELHHPTGVYGFFWSFTCICMTAYIMNVIKKKNSRIIYATLDFISFILIYEEFALPKNVLIFHT